MPAFDDRTLVATATCSNGHPIKIMLGQAKRSQTVRCPRCSGSVAIDGRTLRRDMRAIDREWDKLQRTLKNLGR